jgi:serine/threonine protein kinase
MDIKTFLYEGNYSKTFKVIRLHDKYECVAKVIKPSIAGMDEEMKASFKKELEILKKADHPFLIEYIDDFEYQKQEYCIITKFPSEGNLKNLLKKKKWIGFTENEAHLYLA